MGRLHLAGGTIHAEDGWRVEHCVGPLGVGSLIVKPERHVEHLADLLASEVVGLGRLLHEAARVVTELRSPEQVYVSLWSHAGGKPGHIHFLVQPVDREVMDRYGLHGPKLQVAMFENDPTPDPDAVEVFADRARRMWRG